MDGVVLMVTFAAPTKVGSSLPPPPPHPVTAAQARATVDVITSEVR